MFQRHPSLLALFNWHSCRRGGATHAYWTGTALDLLAPHGGWNSMEGLQVYISASFIQRLSVTQRMWFEHHEGSCFSCVLSPPSCIILLFICVIYYLFTHLTYSHVVTSEIPCYLPTHPPLVTPLEAEFWDWRLLR